MMLLVRMSRRVVMGAHGVMCDTRHVRQEEVIWLAQSPGDFRRWADERDLVVRGVGPWFSEETDVFSM